MSKVQPAHGAGNGDEAIVTKPAEDADVKEKRRLSAISDKIKPEKLKDATEWERAFAYLTSMKTDAIVEQFWVYSYIIRCATSPLIIFPGLFAALWVGVTETYVAVKAPSPGYLLGYVSGPSSFALALGIVLVPSTLKGGLFRRSLHQDRLDTTSYYEILDVLAKDILYVWNRDATDKIIIIKNNKDNEPRFLEVRWWVRAMYCCIFILTLGGASLGWVLFSISNRAYQKDDPTILNEHERFMDKWWRLQWYSMSQTIMYTVATFIMTTGITTLYLAAFLHRKHTEIFVRNLKKYRTPKGENDSAACCNTASSSNENPTAKTGADGESSNEHHAKTGENGVPKDEKSIAKTEETDAFNNEKFREISEKYLMIQHLFQRSSTCWSILLTVWILLTGGLFIMGAIVCVVLDDAYMKKMAIIVSAFNVMLCIIPIILLAYANGFVDHIIGTIQQATWEDFKVIGGRDKWLEYVKTNPTYWYTMGFAITKAWVLGFISGALSTFGAVAIERLSSNN